MFFPGLLHYAWCHSAASSSCTSVFGLGIRQSRGSIATPGTPSPPTVSSLSASTSQQGSLSVYCRRLRRAFLVDSGADLSVFPASASQKKITSALSLQAANGSSIKTFGKREIFLSLPGLSVVHRFVLADVQKPILSSDFFCSNGLLIDIARQRLVKDTSGDISEASVVIKARPAEFAAGLCGLRCSPSFSSVDSLFAAYPTVTAAASSYDSSTWTCRTTSWWGAVVPRHFSPGCDCFSQAFLAFNASLHKRFHVLHSCFGQPVAFRIVR